MGHRIYKLVPWASERHHFLLGLNDEPDTKVTVLVTDGGICERIHGTKEMEEGDTK